MYQSQRLVNLEDQLAVMKVVQVSQLHHGLILEMKMRKENAEKTMVKEKNKKAVVVGMDCEHDSGASELMLVDVSNVM